jgi:hypothetical protein
MYILFQIQVVKLIGFSRTFREASLQAQTVAHSLETGEATSSGNEPSTKTRLQYLIANVDLINPNAELRSVFGRAAVSHNTFYTIAAFPAECMPLTLFPLWRILKTIFWGIPGDFLFIFFFFCKLEQMEALEQENNEQQRPIGRQAQRAVRLRTQLHKDRIVKPKPHWPRYSPGDISMTKLGGESSDNVWFCFDYTDRYRQYQTQYHDCVSSHDPQSLVMLLQHCPFHVDTLLQVTIASRLID